MADFTTNSIKRKKKMSNRNATVENALLSFFLAFAVMAKTVFSQDCQSTGCPGLKECCSSWGSCGIKDDQCGFWCFSGLCNLKNKSYGFDYNVSAGPRGPIESIVTPSLFKRIMSKVGNNCPAKGFYTHQAFISAVKSFQAYKGTVAKREIAAILTHFAHGSKGKSTILAKDTTVFMRSPFIHGHRKIFKLWLRLQDLEQ